MRRWTAGSRDTVRRSLHRLRAGVVSRLRPSLVELLLVASLSALYVVFRVIPTFPMIAVPGATFRAGDFVAPLYGLVLGPILGPSAIALGTFVGFFVGTPPVFLGLDFLPAATSAAIVGLATRRKRIEAILLNVVLVSVFLMLPYAPGPITVGSYEFPYVWLHLIGLALLASPFASRAVRTLTQDWTTQTEVRLQYVREQFMSMLLLAFIATLAQHVMGGILTQAVVGLNFQNIPRGFDTWQAFWTWVFLAYPPERTVIAVAASLIATPAVIVLKRSRLTQQLPKI